MRRHTTVFTVLGTLSAQWRPGLVGGSSTLLWRRTPGAWAGKILRVREAGSSCPTNALDFPSESVRTARVQWEEVNALLVGGWVKESLKLSC